MEKQCGGLLRHVTYAEKDSIVASLSLSFRDVYDSLEATRENLRYLEAEVEDLLHGEVPANLPTPDGTWRDYFKNRPLNR